MLALNAADFVWIGSILRYLIGEMDNEIQAVMPMEESYMRSVAPHLNEVAARCKLLELPISEKTTLFWEAEFRQGPIRRFVEGRFAIEEIERTIKNELSDRLIYYMPRDRASEQNKMYLEARDLWEKPWPIAWDNLDSARFCYAYEEFTASVFHSMRAAEKLLTTLAVSLAIDASREQWQTLIERIEAAIKEMDNLPKGDEKEKKQTLYSETAMQFRYIKNAWRNHVMHGRVDYGEKDAREIWWHVKRSLEKACTELSELIET